MGPWWLTWHLCLYICENCEMSRLWHTNTRTDRQWKVGQYSVGAESAIIFPSHFASIVQIYGKLMEIFVFVESTVGRGPHGIHVHEEKIRVMDTDEVVQVFVEKHQQNFVVSFWLQSKVISQAAFCEGFIQHWEWRVKWRRAKLTALDNIGQNISVLLDTFLQRWNPNRRAMFLKVKASPSIWASFPANSPFVDCRYCEGRRFKSIGELLCRNGDSFLSEIFFVRRKSKEGQEDHEEYNLKNYPQEEKKLFTHFLSKCDWNSVFDHASYEKVPSD